MEVNPQNQIQTEFPTQTTNKDETQRNYTTGGNNHTGRDITGGTKEENIRALETIIEELSVRNLNYIEENSSLRKSLDTVEKLKQDNEKLRMAIEQLKLANHQFQIANDQLHAEIKDRENDEQRLTQQITILKKELYNANNQLKQHQTTHEKQHLKTMLVKFIELICKPDAQIKEAMDILKIICSIIDTNDKERNDLMALLGRKDEKKKSGVFKLF